MKSTLLKMIIVLLCLLSLKGHSQLVVINADCKGAGSIEFPQIVPADKNMTVNYIVEQQNENGGFSVMTNSMSEWKFWAWAGSYRCSYETYYYDWTTQAKSGLETHPMGIVTITKDSDTKPPTGKSTQYFLGSSSPTVGSLRVWVDGGYINEIWYDAATGGNVLARTTLLENNKTYYVSSKAGNGCPESTARFEVTVKLINPQAPTGSTSQSFCADSNPTVANLVTNETSVVWYDASAGGNVVPSTTPLVNGTTYYGAIEESFYNEYTVYSLKSFVSPTRLAVTVAISNNPAAPTGITSQTFCASTNATVASLSATGTAIKWYDAAIGGNVVTSSTALTNGTIYYASQTVNGCESTTRLAVTVTISDPQTPTGTAAQEFCKSANATVASLQTNESGVTWYDAATAGNVVTSTTVLVNGTTYYGSLRSGTCESPTRLAVTVTISDPQTPTGTASQEFYKSSNATVASLVTNERGVTWFDAATAGNVVPSTTILTNGTTYYGSLKTGTCESPTRLAITIKLKEDPKTATTANPTQEFLNSKNPTVADLKVNESNVVWYDAPVGGNRVDPATALVDGKTYYGATKDGDVESPTRLAITIKLKEDPKTATTTNPTQEFLNSKNPTVADLKVNESNVVWYDAPIGGNRIDPATALVDGKTYYGATKEGDVESPTRLAITIKLKEDPKTATTTNPTQEFLNSKNPTVADLKVNESNVVWYDAPVGGNRVDPATALVDGKTYYGATKDGDVESPTRLPITIKLKEDPKTATTTNPTQEFLNSKNPTVADLKVNESNVVWYDAPVGGNRVDPATALVDGKTYYGATKDGDVESPTRLPITIKLKEDPKTATTTNPTQEFLNSKNATVADLKVNESNVVWYDAPVGGNRVDPATALVDGKTYYGATKDGDVESPTRLPITIKLKEDPKTATTTNPTQEFLNSKNATVADLKVNESNVVWYDAPVGGNRVDPATALVDGKTYYGATKDGDVESPTRLPITIKLKEDPKTATTTNPTQEFLNSKNPTVADLKVNESNVVWYDAPVGGNRVDPATALVDGKTYYGATKDGDVESPTRLAITVKLKEDPKTATTANPTQEFLNSKNPTVADLKVNESNVVWYDAPVGGNRVDPATALVDGKTYYGATKDGDVESPTRLPITIKLKEDPKTATTTNPTQEFLNSKNPTVADLKVNESNVVWYDAPVGGNRVDPATALVDGKTYYGATKDGDVESPTRLAVTVSIKTLGIQDFEFSNYFVLYPNPVSDVLTIKTKQDAEIQSLEVYDIFGQLVVSVPDAKSVSTVDVSNLSTGNYFIKVKSDKGSFKVKFVKK